MKKRFSLILVLIMLFSMNVIASAASNSNGKITIENPSAGQTYEGYKIFEATYDGDKAAYSVKKNDPWFDIINKESSPFNVTPLKSNPNSNHHVVTVKESFDNVAIIGWFNGLINRPTPDLKPVVAGSSPVKWDNIKFGYYLVTSTVGSVVTVTNADNAVTIVDKNEQPKWETPANPSTGTMSAIDPETGEAFTPVPGAGKNVSVDGKFYGKTSTASFTDKMYFKINAYVPKYNQNQEVQTYTFTDTLPVGFTYNNDISVTINGEAVSGTDAHVDHKGQTITVKLDRKRIIPVSANVEVTYTATAGRNAVYESSSPVNMSWTQVPVGTVAGVKLDPKHPAYDPNNPDNSPTTAPAYDPANSDKKGAAPADETTVTHFFGFNIDNVIKDSTGKTETLNGAEFKLYDHETEGTEIKLIKNNGRYQAVSASAEGAAIEAGQARIFGIKAGTYYLEQTKVPSGYNMVIDRIEVNVTNQTTKDGILENVEILNNSGIRLPETGGVGTTIFYIFGSLIMLAAVGGLIARDRAFKR